MKAQLISLYIFLCLVTCIFNSASAQNPDDKNWSDQFGYPGIMGIFAQTESNLALTYKDTAYFAANFTEFGQQKLSPIIKWDGKKISNFSEASNTPVINLFSNARIFAFAVDSTGNFYIGGNFKYVDGKIVNGIAMWNGKEWVDLVGGCSGEVRCITAYPDGVYVGGAFDSIGGKKVNSIARWDGNTWNTLDSGVTYGSNRIRATVTSIAKLDTELYVVANSSLYIWDKHQWEAQNITNTTEDHQLYSYINGVAANGNDVYICGTFDSIDGRYAKHVAKRENDSWVGIGNYTGKKGREVYYIGFVNDKLFVRGYFSFYQGNDTLGGMLLFDNGSWKPFAKYPFGPYGHVTSRKDEILVSAPRGYAFIDSNTNLMPTGLLVIKNDSITKYFSAPEQSGTLSEPIDEIAPSGNKLYVVGSTYIAGLRYSDSLMVWDGNSWSRIQGLKEFIGHYNTLQDITASRDRLYLEGDFLHTAADTTIGVVMYDSLGWHALYTPNILKNRKYPDNDYVLYPTVDIMATNEDGTLATVGNYGLLLWKDKLWTSIELPHALNDTVSISAMTFDLDTLYVNFTYRHLNSDNGYDYSQEIYKWDGNIWQSLNKYTLYYLAFDGVMRPSGYTKTLALNNGSIYVSGFFSHIDNIESGCIAGFSGDKLITFGKGAQFTKHHNFIQGHHEVSKIVFHNDDIYITGVFDHISDSEANSIARWDGNSWHSVGSGVQMTYSTQGVQLNGKVNSMCIFDNKLYVAGDFERAGGKNAHNISYYELPPLQSVKNTSSSTSLLSPKINPNPASGIITVTLDEANNEEITVSDVLGRIVKRATAYSNEITLDCTELPKGTYYLSVGSDGSETRTAKFVLF